MASSNHKGKQSGKDEAAQEALLSGEKNESKKFKEKAKDKEAAPDNKGKYKKRTGSTWKGTWKKLRLLWPFMWPRGNLFLQIRVVVCMLILLAARGVALLNPILYKELVNSLTVTAAETDRGAPQGMNHENTTGLVDAVTKAAISTSAVTVHGVQFRWDLILLYILAKTLHGSSGYLTCLRSYLWIKVGQNTKKTMALQLFSHLHNLSIRWHLTRKTGEVLRVMDRGVTSINLVLSQLIFNIAPVIVDIMVAVIYFVTVFNAWMGLIVCVTMLLYLVSTVMVNEWRTRYRRLMNEADNEKTAASVDSILNFETVKYYGTEAWEVERYSETVDRHLQKEYMVSVSMNVLNGLQKTVMMAGLLTGSLLTAWYVCQGQLTVGDFVLFAAYIEQLYGPLNSFGTFYRILQSSFVDMENMLDMMQEEIEVKDAENAAPLKISSGAITFDNVSFSYNEKKEILHNVSFTVPPGKTYALVGETGGGKSTVIRLLLRFYDIQSGCIKIDGQDISKVTQRSLRKQLGVVPQDTTLFNQNIRYNIQYGRVGASDEEVEEAALAADIHNRIVTFPDGYDSKVGERGLKLSGGEKQRVAIARTILKGPEIVLLDEATAALDTKTERNIQSSLGRLCQNKTTIVVAHRLSTIISADQIIVIKNGQIIESGTHENLLELNGMYAEMWQNQLEKGETGDNGTEEAPGSNEPESGQHGVWPVAEVNKSLEAGAKTPEQSKHVGTDAEISAGSTVPGFPIPPPGEPSAQHTKPPTELDPSCTFQSKMLSNQPASAFGKEGPDFKEPPHAKAFQSLSQDKADLSDSNKSKDVVLHIDE